GTRDGNEIIGLLKREGYRVLASAVTGYGASLAQDAGSDDIVTGALNFSDMTDLIEKKDITAVVDATHPFAVHASKNAMAACKKANVIYIRYERKSEPFPDNTLIYRVKDFKEASEKAVESGETVFYTAGSKNLEIFLELARKKGRRIVVRVLPDPQVVKKCIELGVSPGDIVTMQGAGSKELNKRLMEEYGADVLVTKNSGEAGGTGEKISAALDLGIPVVLIERPEIEYGNMTHDYEGILQFLSSGE
ncbi:MAG: precorrin-6A reductase, partial [Candidatus Hydrothermarchaeales archaeon]